MELAEIKVILAHSDSQERLKGIVALKDYDADIASPLLLSKKDDAAFLVRSFVAMGLGRKRSPEGFEALQAMIDHDPDPNVQAEATNSLAMYGPESIPHLVNTFHRNGNWLVRRSILAAMIDLNSPAHMLEICLVALQDPDLTVINAGVDHLSLLPDTDQATAALAAILSLKTAQSWYTRMHVAYALKRFKADSAQAALIELRQDEHHKVVAAALEGLVS
ncbi:MAG: HEAT repeat domain-containing protein [Leptolyngbyaceae cyanobacterium MAG.088]|nr:HEAT repeat domain-containing protein [Leptolyngbyaceae cyanobacterium MAG.088]